MNKINPVRKDACGKIRKELGVYRFPTRSSSKLFHGLDPFNDWLTKLFRILYSSLVSKIHNMIN